MASLTTIDRAGRLVVPKEVREALFFHPGRRLRVRAETGRAVIEPDDPEANVVERDGLLLLGGRLVGPVPDHRAVRSDRIERLASEAVPELPAAPRAVRRQVRRAR